MSTEQVNDGRSDPRQAICGALQDVLGLLMALDSIQYQETGMRGFSSSIGAHTRHCVDHVDALLLGLSEGEIRYDRRERGTQIEHELEFAISAIRDRQVQLGALSTDLLECKVRVAALVTADSGEKRFRSSGEREALYVFHHTVHHLALMASQAAQMGISMDGTVGRAPATIAADLAH
ncbi:MAG: DinB family protein [Planctomycetota bacterium]|nr:DinB family protein [Planctomycetota bacterium]